MPRIYFSMAGEGRGHATRVRGLVEQLPRSCEVVLYAAGDAYELLSQAWHRTDGVTVREIPGLRFHYCNQRLSYTRSIFCEAIPYIAQLPFLVERLCRDIRREQPDLIVTDFEPAMPRAARRCGRPFVSFDHQHFLLVNDLSGLPRALRWKCRLMSLAVRSYYSGQQKTIVSSFYQPPLKPAYADVSQVGVLLRPEIVNRRSLAGQHLLVYLRRHGPQHVLQALRDCGREVRIYGLGERPAEVSGRVQYCPVDERTFLDDLASCHALVSTAGNQLVGEALSLRKPVFAMSETGNFEQQINGHFLRDSGGGDWCRMEDFRSSMLQTFLDSVEDYRARLPIPGVCGNDDAVRLLMAQLPQPPDGALPAAVSPFVESTERVA